MRAKYAMVFAAGLVLLTGFAVPTRAQAILSPDKLVFQCVAGRQCALQTTTLANVGNTTVKISSITLSGGSGFSLTNTCGTTLAAGQACSITIGFRDSKPGTYSAVLMVNDTAPNSPQKALLEAMVKK
jgi:hypothetical protein